MISIFVHPLRDSGGARTCRNHSGQERRETVRMILTKDPLLRNAWDFCANCHSYDSKPPLPASRELPPMGEAGQFLRGIIACRKCSSPLPAAPYFHESFKLYTHQKRPHFDLKCGLVTDH